MLEYAEFLQMLTSQANEKAAAHKKSTINESHALEALDELGFAHYLSQIGAAEMGEKKHKGKGKRKGKRGAPSGLSEEELLRMQQEMFASARQKMEEVPQDHVGHVITGASMAAAPAGDGPTAGGGVGGVGGASSSGS